VQQPISASDTDRTPYVELRDGSANPRASVRRGGLETSQWLPGDLLIQQMNLTVPVDLGAGDYELRFGLALPPTTDPSGGAEPVTVPAATLRVRATP
jgi:hypothetical protein